MRPAIGSEPGPERAVADHHGAALQLDQAVDRNRHVAVVIADHDDVVTVADAGGKRAMHGAEALDEGASDVAVLPWRARAQ